ncbi:MAG TPA: hypothetical protein VI792_11135, partial [Candidatus Eisenbacteria bacterium]
MTGLPLVVVAVLVPGMAVLAALGLARALERRERSQTRRAVRDLAEQIEAFVVGRIDSRALRRAVAGADPESFWGALEGLTFGHRRVQRRALSEALAGNPHARRERRALRDDSPWRRELAARRLALLTEPASRRALRAALERGPAA